MLGKCDKKCRCLACVKGALNRTEPYILSHPVRVAVEIVQCVTDSQLFQWHAMENVLYCAQYNHYRCVHKSEDILKTGIIELFQIFTKTAQTA